MVPSGKLECKCRFDHLSQPRGKKDRKDTRGTGFVVYEDIYDAKNAREHLSGFNVKDRYLIVLYYQQQLSDKKKDLAKQQKEIANLRQQLGEQ
jgi:pre-mRNA branch site protein p14